MKKQIIKGVCAALLLSVTAKASSAQAQSAPRFEPNFDYEEEFLRELWGPPALRGTKCWASTELAFNKPIFAMFHFFNPRHGHSLVSGQIVKSSGKNPERVLQVSGSAGYHEYPDEGGNIIARYLMDLTSSYTQSSLAEGEAFTNTGFSFQSHFGVRVDATDMSAEAFEVDMVSRWETPLTGPYVIHGADTSVKGGPGVTANYMGGIECRDNSCGSVLPLNNRGSWKLVGRNYRECRRLMRNLPLD